MTLRHAWQRKGTNKHGENAQVVPIWYSFFAGKFMEVSL